MHGYARKACITFTPAPIHRQVIKHYEKRLSPACFIAQLRAASTAGYVVKEHLMLTLPI